MTTLRDTALGYGSRGWPIFPCQPGGKVPATRHGLNDATTDLDRIDRYWSRQPDANIGIRTGVAFDALDLDVKNGLDGIRTFRRWADDHGVHVDIWSQLGAGTPTGGAHVYCTPTGAGNRASMLPGVDWRGRGGYVVAPGSRHPDGLYWWLDGLGSAGVLDTPEQLRSLVSPPHPEHAPGAAYTYRPDRQGDPHGTAYGLAALRAELHAVATAVKGSRNHTLNAAAFSLYQLVEGGQLDEHHCTVELIGAATAAGLGEREITQTLKSARSGAVGRARNAPPRRAR